MRVVSWNVLAQSYLRAEYYPFSPPQALTGPERRARLVERAVALRPDVLCLQEVEPEAWTELSAAFPAHEGRFLHKGEGRPDGCGLLVRRALGPVAWRDVRYADGTGHVALLARLPELGVATTHLRWHRLDAPGSPGPGEMRELLAQVPRDQPWIVCGDLNAEADSEVLTLARAHGLRDAYAATPEAWTANSNQRRKRIDFLLLGPGLAGAPLAVPPLGDQTPLPSLEEPSDHLPIGVDLAPPARPLAAPARVVSLVPSLTELLADLGLDEQVVGLTTFCVRPPGWKARKARLGGTKQLKRDAAAALGPELVLANREENTREDVEWLRERAPVHLTDVRDVPGALEMIRGVAGLVGRAAAGRELAERIAAGFAGLEVLPARRAAYLIWRRPWMVAGGDTFIGDVMRRGGLINVFEQRRRYPEVSPEELAEAVPELLLLSSEPFPFKPAHAEELRQVLPAARPLFVDGELFSWYGSRLLHTPAYLRQLAVAPGEDPEQRIGTGNSESE